VSIFDQVAEPGWTWFEEGLAYENAKLAHALIVSGRSSGQKAVFDCGMQSLRWLVSAQTSPNGQFRPISGRGHGRRGGLRESSDQQPIEAQATASACLEAFRATSDLWWYKEAQKAFDWFLGWNCWGLELYCPRTGGCRDGLHDHRTNDNQGAESLLAFLLSFAEMRLTQSIPAGLSRAAVAARIAQ
jgi:hypothetical protein